MSQSPYHFYQQDTQNFLLILVLVFWNKSLEKQMLIRWMTLQLSWNNQHQWTNPNWWEKPVFDRVSQKAILHKLGSTTAINIWQEVVVYDELTINERQKTDTKFSEMLDSVRCGFPTEETVRALKERVFTGSIYEKYHELEQQGKTPVCLFPILGLLAMNLTLRC